MLQRVKVTDRRMKTSPYSTAWSHRMPNPLIAPVAAWAGRLRFPRLLLITGALWATTLVVPDPIPLLDEIVLTFATLTLASFKRRRQPVLDPD
jgi:hypothetical protein